MMRPSHRARSSVAVAASVVERLRQTVAAETEDIARRRPIPYETYSLRKNQALFELNRLLPALKAAGDDAALREGLMDLCAKLEANRRALGVELKASLAVAEIITRAIRDGQSDGTYDALAWKRG